MKRIFLIVPLVLLSLLVMLGSGGFTIGKMICGGNECASTYSFGAAKDCCANEKSGTTTLSSSCCCELINVSYSLDEFSVSEKTNVSADLVTLFTPLWLPALHSSFSILHSAFLSDPSPPEPRELLFRIGALLL